MKRNMSGVILYFLKRYKRFTLAVIFSSFVVAFFESVSLAVLVPVLNLIFGVSASQAKAGGIINIINRMISLIPLQDKIASAVMLLLCITLLKGVSRVINEWIIAYSSGTIIYDTKKNLMSNLGRKEYQYFLDNKQGEVGYYLLTASAKVGVLIFKVAQITSELCMIAAIAALLFVLNVYATLAFIAVGILFVLIVGAIVKNLSYTLGREKMDATAGQSVTFNEFFNGIKQITIFGTRPVWLSKFDRYNKMYTKPYITDFTWLAMPTNMIEVFGMSAILGAMLLLRLRFGANIVSFLPLTGVYAMSLLKILPALGTISRSRMELMGAIPDSEAIIEMLDRKAPPAQEYLEQFNGFSRSIRFDRVSFVHSNGKHVLDDISFSIEKDKITAIVGGSGTGKTTIINILLGLFNPTKGRILADDLDLSGYETDTFRRRIGFVSQDSFVFHSTIRDNITFCSEGYSDEDVAEAARAVNLHDFIMSLDKGYDTIVGERGMKLSGGQQQKLAIARALIRKPEILILDEATSALDNLSEQEIHQSITALIHKYTIVLIAHRLSTVKDADKIIVLEKGRVAEEGSHEDLLKKGGAYSDFYNSVNNAKRAA